MKKDPEEKNIRKILNFGHTIGHAIESYALKKDTAPLLHGEAIAIGMICESYLSSLQSGFSKKKLREVTDHLFSIYGKYPPADNSFAELLQLMLHDKKNLKDAILFTLLKDTGKPVINQNVAPEKIIAALRFYSDYPLTSRTIRKNSGH